MTTSTLVKQASRGQVTVPASFRRALKLGRQTVYRAELRGVSIVLTPLIDAHQSWRDYTNQDIKRFLAADRLDAKTARRAEALLASL